MFTRREWMKQTGGAALAATLPGPLAPSPEARRSAPDYEQPMFDLPGKIRDAAKIESIELLRRGSTFFVRTRSTAGAVGLAPTKQVEPFVPIFKDIVAPFFLGKDARGIETLVDEVYRANYKLAGLAFWCPVAYIEQSLLDLLGRMSGRPVGDLLGGVVRREIPVYLSGSGRETTAEQEVDVYVRSVEHTGTKIVKFKIGGRMSRNLDAYPGRTDTLLRLARQRLGPDVTLYADANGSYDAPTAIEIGRRLEALGYAIFEEPCPWEELSETQRVARALKIPVACGEQDSSLWRFQWMLQNGVMDIVQPDINYNGGLIRAARVARIARKLGKTIVPHNTQTGAASVNILQFASCTPNIGPAMEYPCREPQKPQSWFAPNFIIKQGRLPVPTGPGLGIEIDPAYLSQAEVVAKVS
ncbi:MAG: mandelate racemase/muconate lactonizing enzyme family protein [Acidobacteria bacterium]|nr:mandelate racemase/muconate lactonizing enzyme family protein [Acidobacteriota bacterium]